MAYCDSQPQTAAIRPGGEHLPELGVPRPRETEREGEDATVNDELARGLPR
jgi:hypothetical protein